MNRLCCFDFDGTLADTSADIVSAVNLLRGGLRLGPLARETVLAAAGDGVASLVRRCMTELDDAELPAAVAAMRECYESCRSRTVLYPGVAAGLARLAAGGWKLCVISNKPSVMVNLLLGELGIDGRFGLAIGGDDGFPPKPAAAALEHAMKRLDAGDRKRNWMLGDHHTDLALGRAAGVNRAFAAYGFGNHGSETWDFRAENFSSFADRLAERESGHA